MGVMPIIRLVLHMGDIDRDPPRLLLRRLVDRIERRVLGQPTISQRLRDRRGQRGLAVVDVTHRADVHVRLGALELRLAHVVVPSLEWDGCCW